MLFEARLREIYLWSHIEDIQRGIPVSPSRLSMQVLLLRHVIHLLYGECALNPLTSDELSLAEEVMKEGFNIPSEKEIEAKRKARADRKQKKLPNTSVVDRSTCGVDVDKMTLSQKRARVEEEDDIVLQLPRSASSYSDASFFEDIAGSLLLPEDEHCLSIIGLVQVADWEVTRNFQVYFLIFFEFSIVFVLLYNTFYVF